MLMIAKRPAALPWTVMAFWTALTIAVIGGITFGLTETYTPRGDKVATVQEWLLATLTKDIFGFHSIASLLFGLVIAVLYLGTRGGRSIKRSRLWRMLRVVFAPSYLRHRSHRLDILYFIANTKVFGFALGWLIVSGKFLSTQTYLGLVAIFGTLEPTTLSYWQVTVLGSLVLYLAYELGYYIDHATSHQIPFFWQFHRVHHEAETLSPLTNWRLHPVDSVKFSNILAITGGVTNGALHFAFGLPIGSATAFSGSIIIVIFGYLFLHLHHTQLWIPFTGWLGRILISPAHHQIHHSTNPAHFNKNMGSCLAVFDWLFGTLHVPSKQREKLTFGVVPEAHEAKVDPHTLEGSVIAPFMRGMHELTGPPTDPAKPGTAPST